jgi:hypothetical protein
MCMCMCVCVNGGCQRLCADQARARPLFAPALQMLYTIDVLDDDVIMTWHARFSGTTEAERALHASVRVPHSHISI